MTLTTIKEMLLERLLGVWLFLKEKWVIFGFSAGTGNILSNVAEWWVGILITVIIGALSAAAGIQKYGENKAKKKKAETEAKEAEIKLRMAQTAEKIQNIQLANMQADIDKNQQNKEVNQKE